MGLRLLRLRTTAGPLFRTGATSRSHAVGTRSKAKKRLRRAHVNARTLLFSQLRTARGNRTEALAFRMLFTCSFTSNGSELASSRACLLHSRTSLATSELNSSWPASACCHIFVKAFQDFLVVQNLSRDGVLNGNLQGEPGVEQGT